MSVASLTIKRTAKATLEELGIGLGFGFSRRSSHSESDDEREKDELGEMHGDCS